MPPDFSTILGDACSTISDTFISSLSDALWTTIRYLWPWYWLLIIFALGAWVYWEIKTRFGTIHFNSKNGFSPAFNSFVGSGSYWLLQTIVFLILTLILGPMVYCLKWPLALHLLIYLGTGRLLNLVGFWVYQKEPGKPRRRYRRKRY